MGIEIERKFLVENDSWRAAVEVEERIMRGYLANNQNATVRVRIKGQRAFLTIKGMARGLCRAEFEYPIPVADAEAMLRDLAAFPPLEKIRYQVRHDRDLWEVDVFAGENAGLVLAELELERVDQAFALPDWVGNEVTQDPRYLNVNLARHPYRRW